MRTPRPKSAGKKRALSLTLVATALLSLSPILSHATVFWDDEMEPGNSGFDISMLQGTISYDTSVKFSGNGSVRLDYPSNCYPDIITAQCGGFTERSHTSTPHVFTRYYVMFSSTFTYGNTETKIILSKTNTNVSSWWTTRYGSSNLVDQVQFVTDAVVESSSFSFNRGVWTCVEMEEKLSSGPGASDGFVNAWVNGSQVLHATGIFTTPPGDGATGYILKRIYRQVGIGSVWFDRIAVGDQRIGCSGSAPAGDTTPPASPIGLTIR